MAAAAIDPLTRQCRAVRRLERLFRCERTGRLRRVSHALAQGLIARRDRLIGELFDLERARRAGLAPLPHELHRALTGLAREIEHSRQSAEIRLRQLDTELRFRRGEGRTSGLRGNAGGQVIGRG